MNLDHPSLADDRAAFEARLDALGVEAVKAMHAVGAFPTGHTVTILEWFKAKDAAPKKASKPNT